MLAAMRQNKILALLEQNGSVRTTELASAFGVVPETIRRDFEELEPKGLLLRIHGGAVAPSNGERESRTVIREFTNYQVKEALCRLAEEELASGDYAFVDNSTTLLNLVRLVDDSKTVSLLTNSVRLLLEAERYSKNNVTMISMGGVLSTYNMSLSGQLNEEMSGGFFPNKAFVSCTGFALDTGFTDTSVFEINAKTRMMGLASQVIMVMDHGKFEKRGLIKFGDLASCDVLITDHLPDEPYRRQMLALNPGLKIIQAERNRSGKQATP